MTSSRMILVQPSWNHQHLVNPIHYLFLLLAMWSHLPGQSLLHGTAWHSILVCTKVNLFSSLDILSAPKFKGLRVYLSVSISAIFMEDNKCICYVNVWKKVLHSQPTFFNGLTHLSKRTRGLKQKCTQTPTPFLSTVFHALSHGEIHFLTSVSSKNL